MSSFSEADFQTAYDIGLDALDKLDKLNVDEYSALAAILTVAIHATFAMAPDKETGESLIRFAHDMAVEDWTGERARGATAVKAG